MITCRELVSFLLDYQDNTLPQEQRQSFEEHLRACNGCVDYLHTYERTLRETRDAFAVCDPDPSAAGIPEPLVKAIVAALAARKKTD